jgi:hypothetical protein
VNASRLVRPLALPLVATMVGLAVAGLVRIHHRTGTVYHGRYVPLDGVTMSRAYESTFSYRHTGPSTLLIGAAIGLLVGVALALVLDRLSGSWPSGSARR